MRCRMINRALWIKGLRRATRLNQADFAELLAVAQPTVSRWENGAEPEVAHWDALKALAVTQKYGLFDLAASASVPLIGFVSAGATVNFYDIDQIPPDKIEMPPGGTEDTVALTVDGDSLAGIADNGWVLYYNDQKIPPTADLLGKLCIVELTNGKVLVKKLGPGRQAGRFDLYSNNGAPLFDQNVAWAARVEWIKPK